MADDDRRHQPMIRPGLLTVSGPYGVGKDTVINAMLGGFPAGYLHRVSTLTTRPSSPDADPSYTTVSAAEFERRTATGEWFVNQQFSGAVSYATSGDEIRQAMSEGKVCLHTVFAGPHGVGRLREAFGKELLALGLLASAGGLDDQLDVLRARLEGRTRDSGEALTARLNHQLDPIRYVLDNPTVPTVHGDMQVFDEIVVNTDREQTERLVRDLFAQTYLPTSEG
jgi:guanylate kinase